MVIDNVVYLKQQTKVLQGNKLGCYKTNKSYLWLELTNKLKKYQHWSWEDPSDDMAIYTRSNLNPYV